MEVTSTKELNIKGKECTLVSNSYPSLKHLRSTELLAVHEREEVEKCNHFTIRGYVASVRERNPNICWPLCIPESQTVNLLASSLPPLVVSRSKQWNCLNCVQTISSSGDEVGNAADFNDKGNKMNTNHLNSDATNSSSSFQQPSDDKALWERIAEADSSVNVSHGECSSGPSSMQKDIQSSIKIIGKEVPRNGFYQFKGTLAQSNHTATHAEEGQTLARREKHLRKRSETALDSNNTSVFVTAKRTASELVSRSPSAEICDRVPSSRRNIDAVASSTGNIGSNSEGRHMVVDNCMAKDRISIAELNCGVPENRISVAVGAGGCNGNLMDLDKKNDDASCSSMVMSDDETNQDFGELCSYSAKENKKLSQKLRSLEEIMRTEDSNIRKKLSCTKKHKEASPMKPSHDKPSRLVTELQHSTCRRRTAVTPTRAISKLNVHENDKEPSLMQWLRKASKKVTTSKLNGRTKQIKKKIAASSGVPVQKRLGFQIRFSAERRRQKSIFERANKSSHTVTEVSCSTTHHDSLAKDDTMMSIPTSDLQPKIGSEGSDINLHRDLGFPDKTIKKKIRKRKRRVPQLEERVSRQIDQSQYESSKKQNTASSFEGVLDDIPLDIAEFLAKKQNEKSLMHAKVADNSLGLSTGNCNMNFENVSSVSGSPESRVQSAAQTKHDSTHTRECDQTVLVGTDKFQGQRSGTCNCSVYRKNNLSIDLNQQAPDYMESSECVAYKPLKNPLPVSESLCSSREKINVQEINIHQRNQELPCQGSSKSYPRTSSVPPVETMSGGNMIVGGFCHNMNVDYYDPFSRRHQIAVPNTKAYNGLVTLSSCQVQSASGTVKQSTNLAALPPLFLIPEQNACHSRRLETSNDDAMSATHLLRLVDHAATSGVSSWPSSSRDVQNGELQLNSQSSWMEAGVRNGEEFRSSFRNGIFKGDGTPGSSYKLHRPVPRIGVLGPLLQKEIMTPCDSNRMQLGCEAKCSHLVSSCIRPAAYNVGTFPMFNSSISMGNQHGFSQRIPLHMCSSPMCEMNKVRLMNRDTEFQPVRPRFRTEICVVNRNPADFIAPDEDNIYMR